MGLLGPNCPYLVFRPQTPNVIYSFEIKQVLCFKLDQSLPEIIYSQNVDDAFWQKGLFPKYCKNPFFWSWNVSTL